MYSFETDPDYQAKLDWAADFVYPDAPGCARDSGRRTR